MNASLDLVSALDPGECHLVEEGFISVVRHGPCQTQAFDRFLLILGCRHSPPPQYPDQQRLVLFFIIAIGVLLPHAKELLLRATVRRCCVFRRHQAAPPQNNARAGPP
jgi:hypothetical protein